MWDDVACLEMGFCVEELLVAKPTLSHEEQKFYKALGESLRQRRQMDKLTQLALAKKLGMRSSAICEYEAGNRRMSVYVLYTIEKFIGPVWPKGHHYENKPYALKVGAGDNVLLKGNQ